MPAKPSAFLLALLAFTLPSLGADWRPITPQELALKQSKSDPNADAECFFRDVRIENSTVGSIQNATTNYVRFKIFNDRGREKYSDVKIEYPGKSHISDVSARTIHPDGTILDVKKDAIFDKVEVKKGGLKFKVSPLRFRLSNRGRSSSIAVSRMKANVLYATFLSTYKPNIPVTK